MNYKNNNLVNKIGAGMWMDFFWGGRIGFCGGIDRKAVGVTPDVRVILILYFFEGNIDF